MKDATHMQDIQILYASPVIERCLIGFLVAYSLSTEMETKNASEQPKNSVSTPYVEKNKAGDISTFQSP